MHCNQQTEAVSKWRLVCGQRQNCRLCWKSLGAAIPLTQANLDLHYIDAAFFYFYFYSHAQLLFTPKTKGTHFVRVYTRAQNCPPVPFSSGQLMVFGHRPGHYVQVKVQYIPVAHKSFYSNCGSNLPFNYCGMKTDEAAFGKHCWVFKALAYGCVCICSCVNGQGVVWLWERVCVCVNKVVAAFRKR